MPTGTGEAFSAAVRPLIALAVAATICYGFLSGRLTADQFLPVASLVLGFLFAKREADKADQSVAAALMRPPPAFLEEQLTAVHRPVRHEVAPTVAPDTPGPVPRP